MAVKEIRSEIVIAATPMTVWGVLTDFEKYGQWNPFIHSIKGEVVEGQRIKASIQPPGASGMTFTPVLLSVKPGKELRWLGKLFVKGLFDGEHIFELYTNTDGSTTFVQREQFSGILVPLFKKMLEVNTLAGFEAMNKKLKQVAEGI